MNSRYFSYLAFRATSGERPVPTPVRSRRRRRAGWAIVGLVIAALLAAAAAAQAQETEALRQWTVSKVTAGEDELPLDAQLHREFTRRLISRPIALQL